MKKYQVRRYINIDSYSLFNFKYGFLAYMFAFILRFTIEKRLIQIVEMFNENTIEEYEILILTINKNKNKNANTNHRL